MLHFARAQVGKPFSNAGMARSILWPRTSVGESWFCAGPLPATPQSLVAILCSPVPPRARRARRRHSSKGGLASSECNPGAATPYGLYKMYSKQAATANPYTLRAVSGLSFGGPLRSDRQPLLAPEPPAAPRHLPLGGHQHRAPPQASLRPVPRSASSLRTTHPSKPRAFGFPSTVCGDPPGDKLLDSLYLIEVLALVCPNRPDLLSRSCPSSVWNRKKPRVC